MEGAPLPDFTAVVRATPLEQLPKLNAALAEAQTRIITRIAEEAGGRRQKAPAEPIEWVRTVVAAADAGLDLGQADDDEATRKKKRQVAQQCIAHWARGQPWASHPSRKVLLVDRAGFGRWLKLHRSS